MDGGHLKSLCGDGEKLLMVTLSVWQVVVGGAQSPYPVGLMVA